MSHRHIASYAHAIVINGLMEYATCHVCGVPVQRQRHAYTTAVEERSEFTPVDLDAAHAEALAEYAVVLPTLLADDECKSYTVEYTAGRSGRNTATVQATSAVDAEYSVIRSESSIGRVVIISVTPTAGDQRCHTDRRCND